MLTVNDGRGRARSDDLATEEPLEMRLVAGGKRRTVAVTMRTPGADFELAAGFLHGEGIVSEASRIRSISYCVDQSIDEQQQFNIVNVELNLPTMPDLASLERHFFTSSACGVCGKAGLDALRLAARDVAGEGVRVPAATIYALPEKLSTAQKVFRTTGGLHCAALFDSNGELVVAREDVGRHNALDKAIGWALLHERTPLSSSIVMVSGRASFEIMQKCVVSGVPIICAVSAPSSLAVSVAEEFGVTLVGFLRERRFNLYSREDRITLPG